MKKTVMAIVLMLIAFATSGCVQEALVIPVATVTGKIVVPPGKVATGVKVTVAGFPNVSAFVNEKGQYTLEFRRSGRFLLIARGIDFDANYAWVDAVSEQTVSAPDIKLSEKIVGEALFIATLMDFQGEPAKIAVEPVDPKWSQESYDLFDDGTNGDILANDGIFARRFTNLVTGSQLYKFKVSHVDGNVTAHDDPHQESKRDSYSEIYILESTVKLARGYVTSDLTGINYSEVKLATKKGSRSMNLDSDGGYSFAMEGNGREYLVFRSPSFNIRAIPVDLSTVTLLEVPTVALSAKRGGEIKLILVKSDFSEVTNPSVVGDFTNWQPRQMYDDGTNGDEVAGDGVYTRVFTGIGPGYYKYAFNITETNQVKDPYQESGDSTYSIIQVK